MPVSPLTTAGVYPTVTNILNRAKVRLNDKLASLSPHSGKVLDSTQAFTQQGLNNGYTRMQNSLRDDAAERFSGDIVIAGIPATTSMDPASVCSISWFNIFDGINYQTAPVLPSDLLRPLWMSERPTGSAFPFPDVNVPNMRCMTDGLQSSPKRQRNGQWEWRGDAIYYPGATITVDFRIRFRRRLPDIIDVGTQHWWELTVPVINCEDALAWWVGAEWAYARAADGDASEGMLGVAAACEEKAMEATKLMSNQDVMANERDDVRRIPYGGGSRGYGGGWGFRG